jgi:hypothetical protein
MRQPAATADRIEYWIRRDVAPCLLKEQYNALATPVPPHLAALVEKLKDAEMGETSGYPNRYLHSDEWNRNAPAVHPKGRPAKQSRH